MGIRVCFLLEHKRSKASCQYCSHIQQTNTYCFICVVMHVATTIPSLLSSSPPKGAVYFDDCELQEMIPIFLIVLGCASLLHTILNIVKRLLIWMKNTGETHRQVKYCLYNLSSFFEGILMLFMLIWLIAGTFWVFDSYKDWETTDEDAKNYCHPVVYLFSFILLVVFYCLMAISLCCCCCLCCIVLLECYLAVRRSFLKEVSAARGEEVQLVTTVG